MGIFGGSKHKDQFKDYDKLQKMKATKDVRGLLKLLGRPEAADRVDAIKALGQIGDPQAVEPLLDILADSNSNLRWQAAEALGSIGDPRAVDALITLLRDDSNASVRFTAAHALGYIGEPKAIEPLFETYRRTDGSEGGTYPEFAAADALRMIGGPRVVEGLADTLAQAPDVRGYAVGQSLKLLERFKNGGGVEALIGLLAGGNGDESVRKRAVMTLDSIGGEKADDFLDNTALRSKDSVRGHCTGDEADRMLGNLVG